MTPLKPDIVPLQSTAPEPEFVPSVAASVAAMCRPRRGKRPPVFQTTPVRADRKPSSDVAPLAKELNDRTHWSDAARQVARLFDLDAAVYGAGAASPHTGAEGRTTNDLPAEALAVPKPGTIVLVTGPSGAGKSSLLRALRRAHHGRNWVDVNAVATAWRDGLVIDQFADDVEGGLWALGRFGLGEVHTYLRAPDQLSDGQRWRLQLALAVHNAGEDALLLADEFAAVLDRVTACVVARALRRAIDDAPTRSAVVATSHEDLERALRPDVVVYCDFGRVEVSERPRA